MDNNKIKITFNDSTATFMLDALGYALDSENYIINKETKERERDIYFNEEIELKELGGFHKRGIIKGDLTSLINVHKNLENEKLN